jgi:signal transduction histidine kinase/ActR/RegA family two-component response regulator
VKATERDSPIVPPGDSPVLLEAILCTEELNRRRARAPDYNTENRALAALVQALADSPLTIFQTLADTILAVFKSASAGVSLLTKDEKRFYWAAIAGAWQAHLGWSTPRDFGPCGDVLDRNTPLLFRHWERRYPYLRAVTPLAEEALLIPFHVQGRAVGTIWSIAHDDRRKFDAEDLRQLERLGRFASAAYQMEQQSEALRQSAQGGAEVQKARESRRAALNLMEDAVQARRLVENLNSQLRSEITERKQAEAALRESKQKLENTVAERTGELLQANAALMRDMEERKKLEEQLLQAQKMEGIGTLAGGIAHDFNNLLNIIQGYAFSLRDHCDGNEEMADSLTVINETVLRGSALVQQLLTLARKSSIKLDSVNVNILIEGLIGLLRQTFPKTIELNSSLQADLPPIMADKNQIEQALLNLCVNARDAMSDRGKLLFKTQSVDAATFEQSGESVQGRYVCLEVTDTGKGMDESIRKRIFEPFFTTKDKGQGTGLGLSVVYGIVKNHNGFINVETPPMAGTSFRLYFPSTSSEALVKEPVLKNNTEITVPSNSAATVLLVEDEQIMLYVLEKTLLTHGYKILQATDGDMAVDIYQRHKETIDVVMLDLGLPKMAGLDVLLKIKQQKPDAKIVIASGYLEPNLRSEIDRAGVKHFLHKPYMLDEVVETFQKLTERAS